MKIYIATRLENAAEHNKMRDILIANGHTITYDWTTHGAAYPHGVEYVREVCTKEMQGVVGADAVFAILPGGRGTHTELGMALGRGVPVVLFAEDADMFVVKAGLCGFYTLAGVTQIVGAVDKGSIETALLAVRRVEQDKGRA